MNTEVFLSILIKELPKFSIVVDDFFFFILSCCTVSFINSAVVYNISIVVIGVMRQFLEESLEFLAESSVLLRTLFPDSYLFFGWERDYKGEADLSVFGRD